MSPQWTERNDMVWCGEMRGRGLSRRPRGKRARLTHSAVPQLICLTSTRGRVMAHATCAADLCFFARAGARTHPSRHAHERNTQLSSNNTERQPRGQGLWHTAGSGLAHAAAAATQQCDTELPNTPCRQNPTPLYTPWAEAHQTVRHIALRKPLAEEGAAQSGSACCAAARPGLNAAVGDPRLPSHFVSRTFRSQEHSRGDPCRL